MKKLALSFSIVLLSVFFVAAQAPTKAKGKSSAKSTSSSQPTKANTPPASATPSPANVTTTPTDNAADIMFEVENHDFGTIQEGTQATKEFKFTNTGKEPLVLSNVQASCGCTTPKWTSEPIMPGKTGTITAVYNSTGRPGQFTKSITVTSNAKSGVKVLTIKGVVEAKPADQPSPVVVPENPKH